MTKVNMNKVKRMLNTMSDTLYTIRDSNSPSHLK